MTGNPPTPAVEILAGWKERDRLLAALDQALGSCRSEHVQQEDCGDFTNRWSGCRSERCEMNFSRADYADGSRHGWLRVTRLADGRQAGLTALEDGRTEYWNELAGELGGPAALLEKVEAWAPLVDARLREGK